MLPWSCNAFMSGFSMLGCSSLLVIPVYVLPHMSEIRAFKFGTHTCSLPIATKQYLLVWPASVSSSGIVMPEEDAHKNSHLSENMWRDQKQSQLTLSWWLTCLFVPHFPNLRHHLRTCLEIFTQNMFSIPLIASAWRYLSVSSRVFSCVMVYISRPKPVARWLLFSDVGVQCLSGVNTDEDQDGGAIPVLKFSLSKNQVFNLFLMTLTISRWHTSFLALTSLWLKAKKLFRIHESLWITNTGEWERTKEE